MSNIFSDFDSENKRLSKCGTNIDYEIMVKIVNAKTLKECVSLGDSLPTLQRI